MLYKIVRLNFKKRNVSQEDGQQIFVGFFPLFGVINSNYLRWLHNIYLMALEGK